jgi:hypothetical protein
LGLSFGLVKVGVNHWGEIGEASSGDGCQHIRVQITGLHEMLLNVYSHKHGDKRLVERVPEQSDAI